MTQKKLKVVAYSDYICPFCYIGYHRISKMQKKYDFELEWRPFEIHPETPKKGVSLSKLPIPREYLEMVMANVMQLAKEDGLTFKLSDKLPNSRLALFISEFARKKGKYDEFHELVLEKYWKEGKDIGDLSLLLELAESIELNRDEVLAFIETDEPQNKLKEALMELSKRMINGVPTFIIGNRMVVGAQSYETFEKVIKIALADNAMLSEVAD